MAGLKHWIRECAIAVVGNEAKLFHFVVLLPAGICRGLGKLSPSGTGVPRAGDPLGKSNGRKELEEAGSAGKYERVDGDVWIRSADGY